MPLIQQNSYNLMYKVHHQLLLPWSPIQLQAETLSHQILMEPFLLHKLAPMKSLSVAQQALYTVQVQEYNIALMLQVAPKSALTNMAIIPEYLEYLHLNRETQLLEV